MDLLSHVERSMLLIEVVDGLDKLGANTWLKCQTTWSFCSFYHLELLAYMLSDMHWNRELKNQDSGLETGCSTSRLRYSPPHLVFFCFGVVDTLEKCSSAKHHFPLLNIAITLLVGKDCTLLRQCVTDIINSIKFIVIISYLINYINFIHKICLNQSHFSYSI